MAGKKKIRTELRKNRAPRARQGDWTRRAFDGQLDDGGLPAAERLSGKGELTRKRTVVADELPQGAAHRLGVQREVDSSAGLAGRVLSVHGLTCRVQTAAGRLYSCVTRRLLKTLATEERQPVVCGDRVQFRLADDNEGLIERVEPRYGLLSRASKGRAHVVAANVDQVLIVASVAEPALKLHLIDRYLVCCEQQRLTPVICLNKVDLIDPANLQPQIGVYAQAGYRVLLVSTVGGQGVDAVREQLAGRETAVVGQSGVGKSSLLNAVEPGLNLRTGAVSAENEKGRHTTTTAQLLPLSDGGYVVDTPGVRQLQLWDVAPAEVAGFFRDLRPLVSHCRYPDCTHAHEEECAVKSAVADGWLDLRRYESYLHLLAGDDR